MTLRLRLPLALSSALCVLAASLVLTAMPAQADAPPFTVVSQTPYASFNGSAVAATATHGFIGKQGEVAVVDNSGQIVQTIAIPGNPNPYYGIASGGAVLFANNVGDSVTVIDATTFTFVRSISTGVNSSPWYVDVDGGKAYVLNAGTNSVTVLDMSKVLDLGQNPVVTTLTGGGLATPASITFIGTSAYVANRNGTDLSVIDTSPAAPVMATAIAMTGGNNSVGQVVSNNGQAFVGNYGINTVNIVSSNSQSEIAVIVGAINGPQALGACGDDVYVTARGTNSVSVIDSTLSPPSVVGASIPVGNTPHFMGVNAGYVYVLNAFGNSVSIIDCATRQVVATPVTGGNIPSGIAFNASRAFVSYQGGVTVLDIAAPTPVTPAMTPGAQTLAGRVGVPVTPTSTFSLTGFTGTPRFVMYPPLPPGLSLNAATGVVSGTPTSAYPSTRHWITAQVTSSGESAFSTLQVSVASGVPSSPRDVSAVAGDASAVVSWTAPESDGGSVITGYTATLAPGGESCETTELTCEVTGLTNGVAYSVRVVATNAAGSGPAGAGGPVTPRTVPSAPRGVVTAAGDASVLVSWQEPESDGGDKVTGYIVTTSPGGASCETTELACEVADLNNGIAYSFEVVAVNAVGQGPAGAGGPVTPRARAQVVALTGLDSEPLPTSVAGGQLLPVMVTVTNARGDVVADERVEVSVSGDAALPQATKSAEVTTDDEGRAVVSVMPGDVGEFSISATAAGITANAGPITIKPVERIAIANSGRESQDRRRVFVDLTTEGIAPGSRLQSWTVRGESCLAEPGKVVITGADGSATWTRRARATLTVWFTHGEAESQKVTLPGINSSVAVRVC